VFLAIALATPLQAATLTEMDLMEQTTTRINGEEIRSREPLGRLSESSEPVVESTAFADGSLDPDAKSASVVTETTSLIRLCVPEGEDEGCTTGGFAVASATLLIEPEEGEQDGDAVTFCTAWRGSVAVDADSDAASAAATGSSLSSSATPPNTAEAIVSEPAYVQVNSEPRMYLGSLAMGAPPEDQDSGMTEREIVAQVGDTVSIIVSSTTTTATPPGGNASASAQGSIDLQAGPCAPPDAVEPVPAVSGLGLTGLAIGLGGLGALFAGVGSRRRGRSASAE
jgi:hypothetical protein